MKHERGIVAVRWGDAQRFAEVLPGLGGISRSPGDQGQGRSSNFPTSWAWDFGDSGTSTEQHPEHTYTTPGTFTVTLTVANGEGSDTLSIPGYITVKEEQRIYLPLVLRNAP